MTSTSTLPNEKLLQQISNEGYAIVPFADEVILSELKQFYEDLDKMPSTGTNVTMFNPSYDYRKMVDEKIKDICAGKAEQLLDGYRVLYTNFMVKEPGPEGDFPLHQDWTYVDENQYCSYAIWIPMQDVNENNGALQVVKGSHRFRTALRGPCVHEPFHKQEKIIKEKYSTSINLAAGEALIWDHRLLHFSRPNISSTPRLAFTLIMVPKEAQVFHCFGIPETQGRVVEKFVVDTDFFMKYKIGCRPESVPLVETIEQPAIDFDEGQITKMMADFSGTKGIKTR